jgi:hypothetical protein
VYGQILKGPLGFPVAQNTKLGWILSGRLQSKNLNDQNKRIFSMHLHVSEDDLLRKFWEIESEPLINNKHFLTEEEKKCEEIFANTTKRDSCGRYIVKLPLRDNPTCKQGNFRVIALKRFYMLEKRFAKNLEH